MRRFIIALAAILVGSIVTGCSTSLFMELNACNCFTLRRGITPDQFEGPDSRTHSWLGPRYKPQPQSTQKSQVGDDVWQVRVYSFESAYQRTGGSWASESGENAMNDMSGHSTGSSHQEYVAFRNGLLDSWGFGTIPRALKGKTNDPSRQRREGR
ncbi:MAG TPA: hypothetical protein VNN08_23260 [Thermoanaerobaculia bacterium]|nr:hypothetical protein [Thermoanaerobaculia bacterium]